MEKGEAVTKRQREGYNVWSDVDRMRGKKRADFILEHSLERLSAADKVSKVKHILNKLGDKAIQDRTDAREKHNAKVSEAKLIKEEKKKKRKQRKEQERMKRGRSIWRGVEKDKRKMWRREKG